MPFWDKIARQQELLEKINDLQNQINDVFKVIVEKQDNVENIKELSYRNEQLEVKIQKFQKELLLVTDEKNKFQDLLNQYSSELFELERNKQQLEDNLSEIKRELGDCSQLLNSYKKYYGEIKEQEREEHVVSENSVDKVFFDDMKIKNNGNSFNGEQTRAIRYNTGHLRLIAGAGSGKTQTVCAKAVYLNQMENIDYRRICMITFTKKAAKEMGDRVKEFASGSWKANKIIAGTFNSVFNRIVQYELIPDILNEEDIENLNIILSKRNDQHRSTEGIIDNEEYDSNQGFDADGIQYKKILNKLITEYQLDKFEQMIKDEKDIKDRLDYWMSLDFTYEQIRDSIRDNYDEKYKKTYEEDLLPISERMYQLLYSFEERRKTEKVMVYNDQILNIKKALTLEKVQNYLQSRFDYIFVDEFQDTNELQINILKLLSPPEKNKGAKIIIVGDPNQSIYAFRGSDSRYIQEFHTIYPDMKTIDLIRNYRSKKDTVQKANKLIKNNKGNRVPPMEWFHNQDNTVFIEKPNCDGEEANFIVKKIDELGSDNFKYISVETNKTIEDKENPNFTNFAVLYRAKHQVVRLIKELTKKNIPFVIDEEIDLSIFKSNDFKWFYYGWLSLNTKSGKIDKTAHLRNVLYKYYLSRKNIDAFITEEDKTLDYEGVLSLLKNKYRKSKNYEAYKKNLVNYLNLLDALEAEEAVKISDLIDCLINFPAYQKEEDFWQNIKKTLKGLDTIKEVEEWRKKSEAINRNIKDDIRKYENKELNALYLLTIHKSKGLAFKNIFIVGCYEGGIPSDKAVNASFDEIREAQSIAVPLSTLEEERRLMYVAITRAKQYAFVMFPTHVDDQAKKPSIFISELNS